MTDSDWTSSTDPQAMLAFLRDRGPVSERKLCLYACACCRSVWHLLRDERGREAVRVSERYADGEATDAHRVAMSSPANVAVSALDAKADESREQHERRLLHSGWLTGEDLAGDAAAVLEDARRAARSVAWATAGGGEYVRQGARVVQRPHLLRDIFGNPLGPVSFSPVWRTEAVVALARGIYEETAWERMPVLADALEDAGCADEAVVAHCRGDGQHCKGCWVVDLVLGRV